MNKCQNIKRNHQNNNLPTTVEKKQIRIYLKKSPPYIKLLFTRYKKQGHIRKPLVPSQFLLVEMRHPHYF